MATIMRDGNWTHFGDKGGRWHYTPAYQPQNPIAPYRGKPPTSGNYKDLREYGNPRTRPGGVLPGPGPSAGGRYRWYGMNQHNGVPTPFRNMGKNPYNKYMSGAKALGKFARKLSPVGRFMDVGFQLLDLWQQTQEPEFSHYDFSHFTNWRECCFVPVPKDAWTSVSGSSTQCAQTNIFCGLSGQLPASDENWTYGDPIQMTGTSRYVRLYIGQSNGQPVPVRRFTIRDYYWLDTNFMPRPYGPERVFNPPVVQPMPHNLTPPRAWPEPYPRERTPTRLRDKTRLRVGPRTKPAPYKEPPTPTRPPHLNVPDPPGSKKWKFPGYGIPGAIYGGLTEIKDGLKCFEKNLKGYRIPKGAGLSGRIHAAAAYAWHNPQKLDGPGFIKCLVMNHYEDKIIGKANKLANQITKSPYWVRPVGPGAGSWAWRMN